MPSQKNFSPPPPINRDSYWMKKAIELAKKGVGKTAPNPAVGAVIVHENTLVGAGYHQRSGAPHAEIEALRGLPSPSLAKGATLYVTLEPCSTYGKTPPCTEAIIQAGIKRVCYGATDPNPKHQGAAQQILEQAGIVVTPDLLTEECTQLNTYWNYRMRHQRPWVIAKVGMSLDGNIASPPGTRWITSASSRLHAMQQRAKVEAILIGAKTLLTDNPALTIRLPENRAQTPEERLAAQPWRIIWAPPSLSFPQRKLSSEALKEYQLFTDEFCEKTLLFENISLSELLGQLGQRGISSLLLEGGGYTLGEAARHHLINELHIYMAPQLQGGPTPAFAATAEFAPLQLQEVKYQRFGNDLLMKALVQPEEILLP